MESRRRHCARTLVALTILLAMTVPQTMPAAASDSLAQTQATSTISGTVVTQDNGLSLGGATVVLYRGTSVVATTKTNANGQYSFTEPAGVYSVVVSANGYQTTRVDDVATLSGSSSAVRTSLLRESTSSSQLREIGSARASLLGNTLASSTTIQHNLDPQEIQNQGFLKAADALGQVPGVNISGGPHTVGDDTFIDIRGMGTGEVRPLLDGHPIGPIGVLNQDTFDYANTPYQLLSNIQVTVGSGATGLYGTDVIGGTIDFQTLNPTKRPHTEFDQTFGNMGTSTSVAKSTGTIGRLGYAVGHVVSGTYGDFAPQQLFQGARPNNNLNLPNGGACTASNDLTTCNTQLNTYAVSGDYKVLNDLVKLQYNFAPNTSLTLTGYQGNHWSDSTGNGDNDNVPFATRLAQIQTHAPNCAVNGGGTMNGYQVVTNANPNACFTAQQFAQASSGGLGGGSGRNRGTSLQDYNARFETTLGSNAISIDAYSDFYEFRKDSSMAAGLDPTSTFFVGTGTFSHNYLTHGLLISDDIASATNDFGFGYAVEHQQDSGRDNSFDPVANVVSFNPEPTVGEGDYSFFIRENWTPNTRFGIYANAWDRRSSVTNKTTLDPRISFVFKPTPHDVARLTGGEADGDPGANVAVANSLSSFSNPSSLNATCNPQLLNPVATAGNGNLQPERSKDLEAAYGHRFWDDTSVNVVGYVSSVSNQLFTGVVPITPFALGNPTVAGSLAGFAQKINSVCGTTFDATTIASRLGLSEAINASNALFRGVELTGRFRVARTFAVDYSYDIQSSQQFGEPLSVLTNNPYILDGGQIVGIPVHKGNVTLDYNDRPHGFEAQLAGYYVGSNNTLNRPAYTFFNAFVSKAIRRNLTLTVSGANIFNQDVQNFGFFGAQLPNPQNNVAPGFTGGAVGQAVTNGFGTQAELFGLSPALIEATLSAKF
jgi:outer membrane receptor for ferrienterochelin and colicin